MLILHKKLKLLFCKRRKKNDMKLLLISHGNLAKEVFNVLDMITGSTENVSYMTLPYGVDLEAYKNEMFRLLGKPEAE